MRIKTIFKRTIQITAFLISCCLCLGTARAGVVPNVWDVVRSQLSLDHELSQPDVQAQLRWFVSHPAAVQSLARAEPYIYHIITEVRKRRLPGELALLPMLESAFNPFAYSRVGAAGLWQLMPGTASDLGLQQDWWYDGRRSVGPSTDAALNFLTQLNRSFSGDWLLAIAAYDAGEGSITRSIKNSGQVRRISFWNLSVPAETKAYVPRLLALAEIVKHPDRYNITLPDIPHTPYFEEVNIGSQIDLSHAARLAGISYKDLIKLNPGYNRWATAPYKPYNLLIPTDKVANFTHNLSRLAQESRVSWNRHPVQNGDSLDSIARRYATTPRLLRELNQLKSDHVTPGQFILIPGTKNTPSTPQVTRLSPVPNRPATLQRYKVLHIVQPGDTLAILEQKYQVSSEQVLFWNHLEASTPLRPGQQLLVWREKVTPGICTVRIGDSLGEIAKRYHVSLASLLKSNPGLNKTVLTPGQRLNVG